MYRLRLAATLPAPPEVVFDYVLDMRNDPEWVPLVEGVEQLEGGGPGAGAVYRIQQRLGKRVRPLEIRVEEAVQPACIRWTLSTPGFDYVSTLALAPHPKGTRAHQVNEYHWTRAPWQVRLAFRLLGRQGLRRQFRALRQVLGEKERGK